VITVDKKQLRQEMKGKMASIPKSLHEEKSLTIAEQLYKEPEWVNAKTVGVTISRHPEVDTYQIIKKAWELGKNVVAPKCIPSTKQMDFRVLEDFNQLETVYFGLLEPKESITRKVEPEKIDLLIVPGLSFTREGYRLGVGGGYYDRFLEKYRGNKISLAFDNQIASKLPVEEHDLPVDKIITDQEVIKTHD
jgi:5-formyltetrahydrofolate cyclo-ligase